MQRVKFAQRPRQSHRFLDFRQGMRENTGVYSIGVSAFFTAIFLVMNLLFFSAGNVVAQVLPVVGNNGAHDPSTMIKDGTRYYVFTTGSGIPNKYSTDLRTWTAGSLVMPSGPPAWATNAVPGYDPGNWAWAPDIAYFNGRYNLYYSISKWATIDSAIGLVTSPSLTTPTWTDQGKVIQSDASPCCVQPETDLTANNCIDPSVLVDTNGTVWLSFGSYSDGILVMQLNPATGKRITTNSPITKIASSTTAFFANTTEGSCLFQRGGSYYLFLNYGGCCSGVDSTYNIRVGRSSSVTGPYLDKNGVSMLNGGGTMVLESTARYIGPGHPGIMNDNGTNWFTFHYYDALANGAPLLGLMRLYWTDDGWPALTNDWSALYTFNTNANEHLGLYNGSLQNGTLVTNETLRGGVANLNGTTNFISLPLATGNANTFATWVKWNGGADWQRIFDFGASTTNYFFLTPRASTGKMRFAITTSGTAGEQQINCTTALPTNSWCHVAVTLDGTKGLVYLNGTPVGTNNNLTRRPWQTLSRSNFLGKSQFAVDPLFSGKIDSFRTFSRALGSSEIRDLAWAHPSLAHRYRFNSTTNNVVWDSIGMAHGTLMGGALMTNGALVLNGSTAYVNLPGGLLSGSSAATVECWATFGANGNWARLFDFGNSVSGSGANYFFYSPHNGVGGQTMEIKTSSTTTFNIPGTLDNRSVHIVGICDRANNYLAVYTNGVLQAQLTAASPALTSVNNTWSFIGRSLFSADAYLNATIDELRIYDERLTPQEIAADFRYGPENLALPVTLAQTNSPTELTISWPAWAIDFAPQRSADLINWTTNAIAPSLINDIWQLTLAKTNASQFFRIRR